MFITVLMGYLIWFLFGIIIGCVLTAAIIGAIWSNPSSREVFKNRLDDITRQTDD